MPESLDAPSASSTDASFTFSFRPYPSSTRYLNSTLVASRHARATADTVAPGRSHSSTIAAWLTEHRNRAPSFL